MNDLQSPGVDPLDSPDNNTVHDVLSFIKSTATQPSTQTSAKSDTSASDVEKAVASSSGVKQIKKRKSKSIKDVRDTKLVKSLGNYFYQEKLFYMKRGISDPRVKQGIISREKNFVFELSFIFYLHSFDRLNPCFSKTSL